MKKRKKNEQTTIKQPKSRIGQYFAELKEEEEELSQKFPHSNRNNSKKISKSGSR